MNWSSKKVGHNLLNKKSWIASKTIFLSFGWTITQDTYFSIVIFSFVLTKFNKFLELLYRSNTASVTLKLGSMSLKLETQAYHLPETHDFLESLQPYWNWNQRKQLTHLFTLSLTRSLAHPLDHPFRNQKATMVFINLNPALFSNLNTTRVKSIHVPDGIHCRLASLKTNSCFSYNLAVLPSVNAKLLCELLSYHKYDNFG